MANPNIDDEELEALMAELEAQSEEIAAAQKAAAETPASEPEPELEPAAEETEAEPELTPETVEAETVEMANEAEAEPVPVMAASEEPEPRRPTETISVGNNLQHYVDVDQFRTDTCVTEINLDQCMIEQSGLRAYYGALAARAEAQAARVKSKFEVVEATLYDHHRKALAATGEKTTEKMVENAVKLDPRWLKAKNLVIEAETIASINKSLVESIKDRRDMIIQLGADRRDEYKGAARVLAERGEREELRERAMRAIQSRAA
ncbi:MAG: hypothetical protein FWF12_00040 [Betaproteobacteria bacterium]|nr:hypothetical protein [Betaproteobacteria bacterium]